MTNILVVDDLPEKLLVYRSILEDLGQNIVTAKSGEEALAHVLKTEFAVILLDVNLPPGMSGFETAALIRKRKKSAHTPIIFLTAFADEVKAAEGYAHGAVDYISTPVVPAILQAKVRVFVELYRMTQQEKRLAEERVALAEERMKREAAEEANRRLQFLARAGAVLGQSLDREETARSVVELLVPVLAEQATLVFAAKDGKRGPILQASRRAVGSDLEIHSDMSRLNPDVQQAVEQTLAGDPTDIPDSNRIALPLDASGRTFAALVLSVNQPRTYTSADRAIAEAYASRAAVALDNALLHQELEDANRRKNEFLSMLAHELRNPLAPIRNAAEVLHFRGSDPERVRWAREVIDRQLGHMVRLVDDLLDVSRITQGKIRLQMEPIEIASIVTTAVEASRPLVESAGHNLEVTTPTHPVWVNGDFARLTQVIVNLLNNAAKYTEEGGRIWLRVESEAGMVVIRVRDTGIGLPPDMLSAVFDLFTQVNISLDRAQGGLGIGLTLTRRLVEMHGGSVSAHSDGPGCGSEFVVRLPSRVSLASQTPTPTEISARLNAPRELRIALIDDNVDAAESLADLLRLVGHKVEVAFDGPSGLDLVRSSRPDVVVLDIGLPGMDGYEVARVLRADPTIGRTTLVAVSGYGREEDRIAGREAGFDHHFVKPVEFTAIRDYLSSLPLARSQTGAPTITAHSA